MSSLLDWTTNSEWWKWFSKWSYLIQTKVYRSSYSLTDEEYINLNGIDYLEIHKICLKSLPLIAHKCHQYFDVCVWELWMWQGGNLSNPELAKELISGQLILNLNWPRVTREHVNHPMKISKIITMCQIMNDLKYTCPMTCVCDFFRIYRELRIELLEHPKRRALKQLLEIYALKLRGL